MPMESNSPPSSEQEESDKKQIDWSKKFFVAVVLPIFLVLLGKALPDNFFIYTEDDESVEATVSVVEVERSWSNTDSLEQIRRSTLRFIDSLAQSYVAQDTTDAYLFREEFRLHRLNYVSKAGQLNDVRQLQGYSNHFLDTLVQRYHTLY